MAPAAAPRCSPHAQPSPADQDTPPPSPATALRQLLAVAGPVASSTLLFFVNSTVTLLVVSHALGPAALAAYTVACSAYNIGGSSVCFGLGGALETLAPQLRGALERERRERAATGRRPAGPDAGGCGGGASYGACDASPRLARGGGAASPPLAATVASGVASAEVPAPTWGPDDEGAAARRMGTLLARAIVICTAAAAPLAVLLAAGGRPLVLAATGRPAIAADAALYLRWAAPLLLLQSAGNALRRVLQAHRAADICARGAVASAVVCPAAQLLLAPRFGLPGVALALAVCAAVELAVNAGLAAGDSRVACIAPAAGWGGVHSAPGAAVDGARGANPPDSAAGSRGVARLAEAGAPLVGPALGAGAGAGAGSAPACPPAPPAGRSWRPPVLLLDPTAVLDVGAVRQFLAVGAPSLASLAAVWWFFDTMTTIAGRLGPTVVGAYAVNTSLILIGFALPAGLSVALSVVVGNALGAGRPAAARRVSVVGGVAVVVLCAGLAAVLGLASDRVAPLYTKDRDVRAVMHETRWGLVAVAFGDHVQTGLRGIFKGAGRQTLALWVVAGSLWLVGLPLAWRLAFGPDGWGVAGLYGGVSAGLAVECATLFGLMAASWDWSALSGAAIQRAAGPSRK